MKYHFLIFFFMKEKASTNHLVIINEDEHNDSSSSMRCIVSELKDQIINSVTEFDLIEVIARKLIALAFMSIMLNDEENLNYKHLLLFNQSIINHIIRTKRAKQYSF